MPKAYEGNEPYIFISYAHKDKDEVLRYIDALQMRGYRVWYDGGIEAGSEWPENIAKHLRKCACVISFVSENFVDSDNCRRELTFSQDLKIEQLSIFIQGFQPQDLPDGIRLQLGLNQAMFRDNFDSDEAFIAEVSCAPMMKECIGEEVVDAVPAENTKKIKNNRLVDKFYNCVYQRVGGITEREKKEYWTRMCKALVWIVVLIELAYIPISSNIVETSIYQRHNFFLIIFFLSIARFFLAWCNLSLFVLTSIFASRAKIDPKPLRDARHYMRLASIASFIVPIITQSTFLFNSSIDLAYFIYLGPYLSVIEYAFCLNLFPTLVATIFYSLLKEKKV